jgi:hypothetical protein
MLAKCTCNDSYRNFCCVESIVFSMLFSPSLGVPSTDRSKQLKEKIKVHVYPFNASEIRKQQLTKDKGVVPEQPRWAPNIPKSKGMMQASAASLMRPASLKDKKTTQLTDYAEGDEAEGDIGGAVSDPEIPDVGRAVLDSELPTKEGNSAATDVSGRKRKTLPDIPRRKIKV